MKQLYIALSFLFVLPSVTIANGRHCRRHCPRRRMCTPISVRPAVVPVQPADIPIVEPVQQVAAEQVTLPVVVPQPEVVVTEPQVLTTRTLLKSPQDLKSYLSYLPHALFATVAGILGFGIFKRYKARKVNPPVPPVPPVAPQMPGAPQAPINGGAQGALPVPPANVGGNAVVVIQQQPAQPKVAAHGVQQPVHGAAQEPVPAQVEEDAKQRDEAIRPSIVRGQDQSQAERDGKNAQQQGYDQDLRAEPAVAIPDTPVAMPVPAAQPAHGEGQVVAMPSVGNERDEKHIVADVAVQPDIAPVPAIVVQDNRDYSRLGDIGFCGERRLARRG